jgi:hypothetical protein
LTDIAFDRFVGIDWSGAEGEHQSGIRVAQISRDAKYLKLVQPGSSRNWSRRGVLDFINSLTDRRTLVGLDFAFSLPWTVGSGCLPAFFDELRKARDLWAFVDDVCKVEPFFYAGPIWLSESSPFCPFIKFWSRERQYEGTLFKGGLLRKTEMAAREVGLQPKSVYRMTGPQVGAGSFAGMRVLHAVAKAKNVDIAIWPFDAIENAKVVIAEIYPAVFYQKAGQVRPTKRQFKTGAHAEIATDVLDFFEVRYEGGIPASIDAIDALISTAAICSLSQRTGLFSAPDDSAISLKEGWIFGVPFKGEA